MAAGPDQGPIDSVPEIIFFEILKKVSRRQQMNENLPSMKRFKVFTILKFHLLNLAFL